MTSCVGFYSAADHNAAPVSDDVISSATPTGGRHPDSQRDCRDPISDCRRSFRPITAAAARQKSSGEICVKTKNQEKIEIFVRPLKYYLSFFQF